MKKAILISAVLLMACTQAITSKPSKQAEETNEVKPPADNQVMCTMDAMQCTDGSWVGRSGTNCEFSCPTAPAK